MTIKTVMNPTVNKSCILEIPDVGAFSISTESAHALFLFCISNIKKGVSQRLLLKLETPSKINFKDNVLMPYEVESICIDYWPEKNPDAVEMTLPATETLEFDINSLKSDLIRYLAEVDPWGFDFLTKMTFDFKLPTEGKEIEMDQTWCGYPVYLDVGDYVGFFIKDGHQNINLHSKCLFTSNQSIPRPDIITEICISHYHYSDKQDRRYNGERLAEIINTFYNKAFDQK